ncbi:MAG: hypothetical protein KF795_29635, partial [Labilithrix sp.]|nr:hypothetical protein [Labilithrix sp.]
NETDVTKVLHDDVRTADAAMTQKDLYRNTRAASANANQSAANSQFDTRASQSRRADSMNSQRNQANNQRYTALSNLSELQSKHFVLKVNVTSNNESAIVRVFTSNRANTVAANQDFNQNFWGCGGGSSVKVPVVAPMIAPAAAAEAAEAAPLGDRVAKPE